MTLMNRITLAVVCTLAAFTIRAGDGPEIEYYNAPSQAERALPFSDAVRVGNLLFLSGKIGVDPETLELVPGGIQAETRQIMKNIRASLENAGSSMAQVVKCTVFIADMSEWAALNEVYVDYFPGNLPARSALGANGLALGARAEIECIAAVTE